MSDTEEPLCVIYGLKLIGENEPIRYVGMTMRGVDHRLNTHFREAKRYTNRPLYHWIRKYGEDQVIAEVLDFADTYEELILKEIFWIAKLKAKNYSLLNCTNGGEGMYGWNPTEATRARMRERQLGRKASEETRLKMSLGRKNRKLSSETRKKISASLTGKTHSDERKNNIKNAQNRRIHSRYHVNKNALGCEFCEQ